MNGGDRSGFGEYSNLYLGWLQKSGKRINQIFEMNIYDKTDG